jgi:hypothetical protein
MGFALITVYLVAKINIRMVFVLLFLHEFFPWSQLRAPYGGYILCCILVVRCEHIQGKFIYLAQMGNKVWR